MWKRATILMSTFLKILDKKNIEVRKVNIVRARVRDEMQRRASELWARVHWQNYLYGEDKGRESLLYTLLKY